MLEVMIVVAILGILVSVALPSFRYITSTTKLKSASTELYLGMIRARNEAVKRNRQAALVQNAGGWGNGWRVIVDETKNGNFNDAGDIVVMRTSAPQTVTITEKNNLTEVAFLTSGRIKGATQPALQVVSQETASMKRCVRIDLTGKPYTSSGTCP